ncbi:MAG: hypothetical protein GY816_22230, partial [Cytophagales bacterium]|nr:hypothetical protein [Cytophagales bacterium]
MDHFSISKVGFKSAPRFRTTEATYSLEFKNLDNIPIGPAVHEAFAHLIETAFADGNVDDKVGLTIDHPFLKKKIGIPFSRRDMMTADKVYDTVQRFVQSSELVRLDS